MNKVFIALTVICLLILSAYPVMAADKLIASIEPYMNSALLKYSENEVEMVSTDRIVELNRVKENIGSVKAQHLLGYVNCKLKMKVSSDNSSLPRSKSFESSFKAGNVVDALVYFTAKASENNGLYKANSIAILGVLLKGHRTKKEIDGYIKEMKTFSKSQYKKEVNQMYSEADTYTVR